jgi:ligand-binding sensor domain-containing protein/DNA-binding CsgD family transcriptional regulator
MMSGRSFGFLFLKVLFVLVVLLQPGLANSQSDLGGQPFIRIFPTVDYHAGIQNWSITQDKRGIIYVANNFGLLEFDGEQWQLHPVKNGTKVRSVAIDSRGRIFVGSQNEFGYFFPDAQGRLQYVSLADSLDKKYRNFDEAWSIFIDQDKVYFCTFSRIYIYDGQKIDVTELSSPLDLSFFVNRNLIVNAVDKGLCLLKGTGFEEIKGGNFFKRISVSGILPFGLERYLVSTSQDGVFILENGEATAWSQSNQEYFRQANINCILRLRNGNVAAGTQNNGLLLLDADGNIIRQLTRGKGLENRTVLGLFEDDRKNLWLGQNNGIAFVELGSPFTFINEKNNLPGTGYAALLDHDKFYLGTNTGLYVRDNDSNDFNLVKNTTGQVYYLGRHGGEVLLGHHKGSYEIDDEVSNISTESGSWVFLSPAGKPDILVGGNYNGLHLYCRENGRWQWKKKIHGFYESSRVMAEDASGNLWITHGYKGAFKLRLSPGYDSIKEVRYYGRDKGFASNLLINVYKIRDELMFTNERGVFKYDSAKDSFVADDLFTPLLGPGKQVWNMQEDAVGNIYYAGAESIGVLRRDNVGEYTVDKNTFNRIRRFLNDDLVNITVLENNEVVFGAKDGFIHYDPLMKSVVDNNFKCLLRRISVTNPGDSVFFYGAYSDKGQVVDQQVRQDVELPFENNALHFHFAAPGYEGNGERHYQYYLEPYEKTWSEFSRQTQKEYTNIREGKYKFHVRARTDNGQISSEATYTFVVLPPWYRSLPAYIVYFVVLITLLFLAFRILDKKYRREQQAMAELQQQQLEQKDTEIEKISLESKEEITRLQNEKLEADLNHMNNELATATMHLLNKNEFIAGIKAQLTQIIRKNDKLESEGELMKITRDIEKNISADSDWEHFEFHFDRVHGDFTRRFKGQFPALTPQEIKLSAYLRMNLSTKEIAQLLNITVRGVEIGRYRLRKKLQLDRNQNLQDFILHF